MDTKSLAHLIYFGDKLVGDYYRGYNSFYKLNPEFKILLWISKDINNILDNDTDLRNLFHRQETFINRYNLIKYYILSMYGGWYVDLDIIWKLPLHKLIDDKIGTKKEFPKLFIPVRSFKNQKIVNFKMVDDMLLYVEKGLFENYLQFIRNRQDIDYTKPYEPYGPISLSKWLDTVDYSREFMFEWEIQDNGFYCSHINKRMW